MQGTGGMLKLPCLEVHSGYCVRYGLEELFKIKPVLPLSPVNSSYE